MTLPRRGIATLDRRLFLKGAAGVVVGLPLLETFMPRKVEGQALIFRYALFLRQANGCQQALGTSEPDRFWPTRLGNLTRAGMLADGDQAVNGLADFAPKLLIVRGCEMRALADAGCGHAQGGLLCLTAARTDGKNIQRALATGESIDNRIVRELQGGSLEPLTLRAGKRSSYLDDVLSYRASRDRRVAESSPLNAYRALFGLPSDTSVDEQATRRRKSINDLVRAEMTSLLENPRLSKGDRYRLQQHQQAIADLEVDLGCTLPAQLYGELAGATNAVSERDDNIVQTVKLQARVMALAVACGQRRAATLQVGNGNDATQYTIDGTKYENFHHISHRINADGTDGTPIANAAVKHHNIDKLFASLFGALLGALDAYPTPTGTLLDEGVTVWLNDLSNGPPHSTRNMPYVCAGSCGGKLKTGVYVDAADVANDKFATHNKFLNTLAAAVGCKNAAGEPLDDFGDPDLDKGRLPAMLA